MNAAWIERGLSMFSPGQNAAPMRTLLAVIKPAFYVMTRHPSRSELYGSGAVIGVIRLVGARFSVDGNRLIIDGPYAPSKSQLSSICSTQKPSAETRDPVCRSDDLQRHLFLVCTLGCEAATVPPKPGFQCGKRARYCLRTWERRPSASVIKRRRNAHASGRPSPEHWKLPHWCRFQSSCDGR
jgi:hypothetical protein